MVEICQLLRQCAYLHRAGIIAAMLFRRYPRLRRMLFVIILLGINSAACAQATPTLLPTSTRVLPLTPYRSPTPDDSTVAPTRILSTSTPPPSPTSTPVTYKVVRGDTMLGVALRHGISLEGLLAANPEVDPRFLSVDTLLVIPQPEESPPGQITTPTPPAVELAGPVCYQTLEASVWCFLLVDNDQTHALENISAWIGIYTPEGDNVAGEVAITPLNWLPAGEAMPIVARFPPPLPQDFVATSDRFSALIMPEETGRYLETNLKVDDIEIREDGLSATIQGKVTLPEESPAAKLIWLLGVAYDAQGDVVGVRRWEVEATTGSQGEPATVLEAGETLPYLFEVYSLGPGIERVEVLVEARP